MEVDLIKDGEIGLVTVDGDRIVQLATTKEMHNTLMLLIAGFSQTYPLIKMGEAYDLVLKSTVKTFK